MPWWSREWSSNNDKMAMRDYRQKFPEENKQLTKIINIVSLIGWFRTLAHYDFKLYKNETRLHWIFNTFNLQLKLVVFSWIDSTLEHLQLWIARYAVKMLYINNNNNYKYIHAGRPIHVHVFTQWDFGNRMCRPTCTYLFIVIHDQHSTTCFCDNSVYNPMFFRTNLELYKIPSVFGVVYRPWPIVLDKVYRIHANVIRIYRWIDFTLIKLQCLCLIYVILAYMLYYIVI